MRFYKVRTSTLWGDYGAILMHGMSCHLPRIEGLIQLERTGPFIPPITLPGIGDVVVTDAFRLEMERSGFDGISFVPVIKARIVQYHWELWDRSSGSPAEFPDGGEPEDYILSRPHSPSIAEQLGTLWEVILPEDAAVKGRKAGRGRWELQIAPASWRGMPLFWPTGTRHVMVTEEVKQWLELRVGDWLSFQEAIQVV